MSSTRVREALQTGDLSLAKRLLGEPYRLCGKVVHGNKRGRDLGFPTANITVHRKLVPLSGIFVVRVHGLGNKIYQGVASLGTRPTFHETRVVLEVYLFDFKDDIYGKAVEVEFLHKLRDEIRYDSVEALIEQMHQDVKDAKAYFKVSR